MHLALPPGSVPAAPARDFDRSWRNARVHTLHDPIDDKLRELGRYALDGRLPEPTRYS